MGMSIFVDSLLNGLTLGAFYALVTLGLALILGVVRLVNFAHGDFFMVGGYVVFLLQSFKPLALPYPIVVVLTVVLLGAFGFIFERLVIHRIIDRSWRVHLVATLASSIILSNAALLIFTSDPKQVPTVYSSAIVEIFGSHTSVQRLLVLGVVILAFIWLQWFLGHTKTGQAMRAISQNREVCMVVGIDIRQITVITFALSAALAGLAAALLTPLFSVSPSMGSLITLKALAAVVLGGMGQVSGSFYAAFILGIVESFFAAYVPGGFVYKDVASFAILIGVLMLRPHGLFGRKIGL
jgi:branched-chain amino acid transport system permease protein